METARLPLVKTLVPDEEVIETLTAVVFAAVPEMVGVPEVEVSEEVIAAVAATVPATIVNGIPLLAIAWVAPVVRLLTLSVYEPAVVVEGTVKVSVVPLELDTGPTE